MLMTMVGVAVGGLTLAYVLAGILLYLSQDMLVFPGVSSAGERIGALPSAAREVAIPRESASPLYGVMLDVPGAEMTILFFGGNGESVARSVYDLEGLRAHGARVLMVDYPGYGGSPGKPSAEAVYETGQASLDFLASMPEAGRIIVAGRSLGTAAATRIASDDRVAGLMLFAPFTTLAEAASRQMPIFPVGRLLRHRLSNREDIRRVRVPILLYHNRDDLIVPSSMSAELEDLAETRAIRVLGESGGHNGIDFEPGTSAGEAIAAFLDALEPVTDRADLSADHQAKPERN